MYTAIFYQVKIYPLENARTTGTGPFGSAPKRLEANQFLSAKHDCQRSSISRSSVLICSTKEDMLMGRQEKHYYSLWTWRELPLQGQLRSWDQHWRIFDVGSNPIRGQKQVLQGLCYTPRSAYRRLPSQRALRRKHQKTNLSFQLNQWLKESTLNKMQPLCSSALQRISPFDYDYLNKETEPLIMCEDFVRDCLWTRNYSSTVLGLKSRPPLTAVARHLIAMIVYFKKLSISGSRPLTDCLKDFFSHDASSFHILWIHHRRKLSYSRISGRCHRYLPFLAMTLLFGRRIWMGFKTTFTTYCDGKTSRFATCSSHLGR